MSAIRRHDTIDPAPFQEDGVCANCGSVPPPGVDLCGSCGRCIGALDSCGHAQDCKTKISP